MALRIGWRWPGERKAPPSRENGREQRPSSGRPGVYVGEVARGG